MTAAGPPTGDRQHDIAAWEDSLLDSFFDTRVDPTARFAELTALDKALGLDPLAEPDFVVVAGDWHGDGGAAAEAMQQARACPGPAIVLQLGDFGFWPGAQGVRFLNLVAEAARVLDVCVLWLDGNHEWRNAIGEFPLRPDGLRVFRPRVYHLGRGFRWSWHGLRFAALGGAVSVDKAARTPGVSWWPQEAITWAEADATIAGGPADVLLSHDVPLGVTAPGLLDPVQLRAGEQNRLLLRHVVDALRPTHVFHGHMHRRYDAMLPLDDGTSVAVTGLADGRDRENSRLVVPLAELATTVHTARSTGSPDPRHGSDDEV